MPIKTMAYLFKSYWLKIIKLSFGKILVKTFLLLLVKVKNLCKLEREKSVHMHLEYQLYSEPFHLGIYSMEIKIYWKI